jgi:DNA-binding protein HU-beta
MNKTDLIRHIAKDVGITNIAAREAINSLINSIRETLKSEEGEVTLSGFGTFKTVHRKDRIARNPMTGEPIRIPARNVVKFKPGKTLKETVL